MAVRLFCSWREPQTARAVPPSSFPGNCSQHLIHSLMKYHKHLYFSLMCPKVITSCLINILLTTDAILMLYFLDNGEYLYYEVKPWDLYC